MTRQSHIKRVTQTVYNDLLDNSFYFIMLSHFCYNILYCKAVFSITNSPEQMHQTYQLQVRHLRNQYIYASQMMNPFQLSKRFVTAFGNTASLYAASCCSKRSTDGTETTDTSIPSVRNTCWLQSQVLLQNL